MLVELVVLVGEDRLGGGARCCGRRCLDRRRDLRRCSLMSCTPWTASNPPTTSEASASRPPGSAIAGRGESARPPSPRRPQSGSARCGDDRCAAWQRRMRRETFLAGFGRSTFCWSFLVALSSRLLGWRASWPGLLGAPSWRRPSWREPSWRRLLRGRIALAGDASAVDRAVGVAHQSLPHRRGGVGVGAVALGSPAVAVTAATLSKLETSHSLPVLVNDTFHRKWRTTAALLSVLVIVASTATMASAESSSMLSIATPRHLGLTALLLLVLERLEHGVGHLDELLVVRRRQQTLEPLLVVGELGHVVRVVGRREVAWRVRSPVRARLRRTCRHRREPWAGRRRAGRAPGRAP